jgi:hypothetical protein
MIGTGSFGACPSTENATRGIVVAVCRASVVGGWIKVIDVR